MNGSPEKRATFSHWNVAAEVHRQLHGVRFASPVDRIQAAERIIGKAIAQALPIATPDLRHTPERFLRPDGSSRFHTTSHETYTTTGTLRAEARLLDAGRRLDGPTAFGTRPDAIANVSIDQAVAVDQVATSGRVLDVLVGPAGAGKSTTMKALRDVWEGRHGAGSVIGLAPSAVAAEVLAGELGIMTENTAKWLTEHRLRPDREATLDALRAPTLIATRRAAPSPSVNSPSAWSQAPANMSSRSNGCPRPCTCCAPPPCGGRPESSARIRGRRDPPWP